MESNYIPVIPFETVPFLDRICSQCKWSQKGKSLYEYKCLCPRQGKNMVTGEQRQSNCSWHRNMSPSTPHSCTGKGLWWEPIPDPT